MTRASSLAFAALFLGVHDAAAQIATQDVQRDSLRRMGSLEVVVERLDGDMERRLVLDAHKIQSDVTRRLAASGVPIGAQSSGSTLYLRLTFAQIRDPLHVYALEVSLRQPVMLRRAPSVTILAPTWIRTRVGSTAALHGPRSVIDELVDEFAEDYRRANPAK